MVVYVSDSIESGSVAARPPRAHVIVRAELSHTPPLLMAVGADRPAGMRSTTVNEPDATEPWLATVSV